MPEEGTVLSAEIMAFHQRTGKGSSSCTTVPAELPVFDDRQHAEPWFRWWNGCVACRTPAYGRLSRRVAAARERCVHGISMCSSRYREGSPQRVSACVVAMLSNVVDVQESR
jgi:hypothetical protein